MKQDILILLLFFSTMSSFAQEENYDTYYLDNEVKELNLSRSFYKSSNGVNFPTKGVFRGLTIFVNVIYDQNDTISRHAAQGSVYWEQDTTNSINEKIPTYLLNLFDVNVSVSHTYNGCITRLYAEASFNELILLSDFMVVNIRQSQITPTNPSANFSRIALMNAVIGYINQKGGLNAIYGHNHISDYNNMTSSGKGLEKPLSPDNKIDYVNFFTMNTIRNENVDYGYCNTGQGLSNTFPGTLIKIGNLYYGYNTGTYQNIGSGDITYSKRNILTHEFAHFFLGGNEFHTSGGVTSNDNYHNTFIGDQFGHGLFGCGLLSCNAYERWRLGWYAPNNNAYPIASSNINSDVSQQFTGEQIFILRDFVTYGDAIRIKLPYKDSESSSNQYIWLENHQYGKNNKIDGFIYSHPNTCRNFDKPGIFAYHQVGKDILESSLLSEVFPINEKDNLRMISAEGNYNIVYEDLIRDCLGWGERPKFRYISPNPLQGNNNQTEAYSYDTTASLLVYPTNHKFIGAKIKGDSLYNDMPWLGSDVDAFIPQNELVMDISTNPAPVNVVTYYSTRNNGVMKIRPEKRNTRKIYLTGLSIKMIDILPSYTGMKSYFVKIRWDDYDVKQDVNWAGDIVLKEKLNLLEGKTITLEQNWTPNQMSKDTVSNFFAPPTKFTCEENSEIALNENSKIIIKDKSSFLLENTSEMIIDGAEVIVEAGSTFMVKSGGKLTIKGEGKIIVKEGACLCVQPNADIVLQDYASVIFLKEGALLGANLSLFNNMNCLSDISFTGNGSVVDGSLDVYIQNEVITSDRYVGGRNIYIGKEVTQTKPYGDVLITNDSRVIIEGKNVHFEAGFKCDLGSTFEVFLLPRN